MPSEFQAAYKQLNAAQKKAVDTIDGPVLVLAGPGTGKTQLLGTRAANIVRQGVVGPGNILCLTFTDSGAHEMRDRLARIMGAMGSEVTVHTFHSFGTWLMSQYPEQFSLLKVRSPLDDLGRYRILESLLSEMPFRHPFTVRGDNEQFARQRDVAAAVQAFKQAGMHPDDLRAVLFSNQKAYKHLQPLLNDIFGTKLNAKRLPEINELVDTELDKAEPDSYQTVLLTTLSQAIQASTELGKTVPLGKWRDSHTTNQNGVRILKSSARIQEFSDTIDLYEKYQTRLLEEGKFDYEDMIFQAADVLQAQNDICLDLAERFQYIMVDEYQDTNGGQNRLLDTLLKANPLDSPNVLVVGDDDQAIMRFQGAEVSGMLQFIKQYQPLIIPLTDNYRSSQAILDAARQIITQTDERLEVMLPELNFSKILNAQKPIIKSKIEHRSYESPAAEYAAVADYVDALLKSGVPAKEIAIIGRKHPELKQCVPHLYSKGISIAYDKRENVLEASHISQLIDLASYIVALSDHPKRSEALLPKVLAAPYWQLPPLASYRLAISARENKTTWLDTMLASSDDQLSAIAEWLIAVSSASKIDNFTQLFDMMIGRSEVSGTKLLVLPFVNYIKQESDEAYITLLSHLICLRETVLKNRPTARGLQDLLDVVQEYKRSATQLLDDNPVLRGNQDNIQVMSAHRAKGREFEHVIILSALDNVWGPRARGSSSQIRLPENLPLYPAGDNESDKLRLLYVAMTRARSHVLLTSYASTDAGKATLGLSYLQLGDDEDGWWLAKPEELDDSQQISVLETAWQPASLDNSIALKEILQPILKDYRLSASALKSFLDIRYSGPAITIEQHVLKFPSAYSVRSAMGVAAHQALHAAHTAIVAGKPFTKKQLLTTFDKELDRSGLNSAELRSVRQHGHQFLPQFVKQFGISELSATEKHFKSTTATYSIPIGGQVDALRESKTILEVVDYKTGKPPLPDWQTKGLAPSKQVSLHFYRQQLLFYKLLLDNSAMYNGKQAVSAVELVFVEPSLDSPTEDAFVTLRIDSFDPEELQRTEQLMKAVYDRIKNLDLPDTSKYSQDLKGILAFEDDLLGD